MLFASHLLSPESQGVVSGVVFVIVLIFLQLQYATDNRVSRTQAKQACRESWLQLACSPLADTFSSCLPPFVAFCSSRWWSTMPRCIRLVS